MKKFLALLSVVLCSGCISAVTHIKGDDQMVTRSVQAEKVLFNSADTLFKIEKAQSLALAGPLPNLHQYVQQKRAEIPRLLLTLRSYTKMYRETVILPKPDTTVVLERAEVVSKEMQGWLTRVATAHVPPPPIDLQARTAATGNPYVDAAVELINLINNGMQFYKDAQAKAVANGVLIDADENLLHVAEDVAMASPAWQLN